MAETAILDIDGTLVDTNYHHAIAWYRAFRQSGIVLLVWEIHRHIGSTIPLCRNARYQATVCW